MDPVKFRVDTFLSFLLYYFVSDNCKLFHTRAGSHCGGWGVVVGLVGLVVVVRVAYRLFARI